MFGRAMCVFYVLQLYCTFPYGQLNFPSHIMPHISPPHCTKLENKFISLLTPRARQARKITLTGVGRSRMWERNCVYENVFFGMNLMAKRVRPSGSWVYTFFLTFWQSRLALMNLLVSKMLWWTNIRKWIINDGKLLSPHLNKNRMCVDCSLLCVIFSLNSLSFAK